MSVKERLKDFIKHRKISIREFCRVIDVSNSFVTSMRNSLQPDKVKRISVHFPELNTGWLLTGEGQMLRESFEKDFINEPERLNEVVSELPSEADIYAMTPNDRFDLLIKQMKIKGYSPTSIATLLNVSSSLITEIRKGRSGISKKMLIKLTESLGVNPQWLITGEGEEFIASNFPVQISNEIYDFDYITIPYVPIQLRGKFVDIYLNQSAKKQVITLPKMPGVDYSQGMVFEVNGDSMEPTLLGSERVYAELVPKDIWPYISGVVVVCFNNYVVIRRIKENDLIQNELTLYNDKMHGKSIILNHDEQEIIQIYQVKYSIFRPVE